MVYLFIIAMVYYMRYGFNSGTKSNSDYY